MQQGWIKLHRELMDKPIWIESNPEQKCILITLLMMASHQEKEWEWKGERFKIQPGQFVTSLESIARKSGKGISIQNVRTSIKRFEKYGFLTNQSTNKNRLITIVNWGIYQLEEKASNNQTNKQLTGNQQATNNYQELKNVKNENKYIRDLYDHYLSKNIVKHKKLTDSMERAINARLKDYSFEELKNAIDNYAKVLHSNNHWFTHKYTLADFMRDKDIRKFVDEADPLNNYANGRNNQEFKQQHDPRDKEIAFQQWVSGGGDPNEFDWSN